ncbi:AMP-binding protein [Gordonia sp. LSe1-13]|uniref:AMP-binding protein n=1 Tax=Gordonia sesuvii TaxID=3116777 RepID=A0ABU7M8S9_9ACTN|nr:AMP-binding protein [Gordonia sp. LSe1-13]
MAEAALVFDDREYTRSQIDALVNGYARSLSAHGVEAGARVALMSSNRPEFVAATYAIWQLGAAVVLISPAWKATEVRHALAVSEATIGVGDSPVLASLAPMLDLDEPVTPSPEPVRSSEPDPEADAVLVFSSGTTGMPKAVRHSHRSLRAAIVHWRDALQMTSADRIQVVTPPSHILGLLNIVTAMDVGARIRLERRFDLDLLLRRIAEDRITIEMAVAPIALAIASHPALETFDLSSLRYIMWGATPVTHSVADTVTRRTGVEWVPAYGASEIPVIACNPLDGPRLDSVGKTVPGVELRIVDLDTGSPVPLGAPGEIQLRAPSLMTGYLPPDANHEAFDDGWYRTGDVGYVDDDGWIFLTDRSKEMIKTRGFQVAPAEVESVLHTHPAVADCAVFGVPDSVIGERIVAAVALSGPAADDELIEAVAERLATYKCPSEIVVVDDIPRLPSGKVLRRVLKENHGCPADK